MKYYQKNYKNITNVLIIFLFFIFNFVQLSAQVQVTGTVTSSEDSQKIPGVSIVVKGTSTGSVTDFSGNYSIAVPSSGTTLIFSSVGMETKEITIDGKTVINIILNPDLQLLDEVVIIGYGSVKKSDLTGSVASISAKNLEEQAPAPSFDILLDGQVAGVQIQRTSGTPGGSVNINIRGISSVTGGNQPLYVIDGFPIVPGGNSSDISFTKNSFSSSNFASPTVSRLNPLTSINPNDIKSIEILKDASATAIYGSRGANGVVLITTKKGKKGEGKIEFDMSYGFQEVASKIDLLNGSQFADYIKDGRNNRHLYLTGGSGSIDDLNSVRNGGSRFPDAFRNPESVKTVTDWQDEIFRIAPIQNYQLSFSGGSKNIDYRVSGGYFQQEGIIKTTDFERYNIRTNINSHLRQNLKIGVNMNAFRTEGNFANTSGHYAQGNVIAAALTADPTVPLFNEDGEYTTTYIFPALIDPDNQPDVRGGVFNPLRHLYGSTDFREAFGVLANTYLEWDIIDKLTFRTTFGVNFSQNST
ncbi:MAG: SusC/RagA family TonB-linked outer membrane protein, partial [Bacteroidetes bacterium]|nr:SusC/RagA family TonB-linked outer membrane protein [Bacteroidota bacterium]